MSCDLCFKLDEEFLNKYKTVQPPFGYMPLGELVYRRTYSRKLEDGTNEDWWQTVQRVVEGTYSLQKEHIRSFQEMYDLMFNMKFLPPGMTCFCFIMYRSWSLGYGHSRRSQEESVCCSE